MTEHTISFGDHVRVRTTSATLAANVAGLYGQVYGETTPSVTGVAVIGELLYDYAINVNLQGQKGEFWFSPEDHEFIDHAPGTEITLDGINKKWIRTRSGKWKEIPNETKHQFLG